MWMYASSKWDSYPIQDEPNARMTDLERAKAIAQLAETLSLESDRRSSYGLLLDASVLVGRSEIGLVKLEAEINSGLIANAAESLRTKRVGILKWQRRSLAKIVEMLKAC